MRLLQGHKYKGKPPTWVALNDTIVSLCFISLYVALVPLVVLLIEAYLK